ncbi:MAG: hypothetical protein DRP06_03340 [Candidatus Aenigmatarchaeota archaeon]|nr:MAG: hypothetical protein DRP06_03340 [Candidatus Aenigmarchaeota archaeon]
MKQQSVGLQKNINLIRPVTQRIVILSKTPSTVNRIIENKLSYPRDKLAPDFIKLKCDITKHFYDDKDKQNIQQLYFLSCF